jgi:hypothetical protein
VGLQPGDFLIKKNTGGWDLFPEGECKTIELFKNFDKLNKKNIHIPFLH